MLAVTGMEVLVRKMRGPTMKMRGSVTPAGTDAEQVAVENLLALASLLLAGGSRDLVLSPGVAAKQVAVPAMLSAAEPLV